MKVTVVEPSPQPKRLVASMRRHRRATEEGTTSEGRSCKQGHLLKVVGAFRKVRFARIAAHRKSSLFSFRPPPSAHCCVAVWRRMTTAEEPRLRVSLSEIVSSRRRRWRCPFSQELHDTNPKSRSSEGDSGTADPAIHAPSQCPMHELAYPSGSFRSA